VDLERVRRYRDGLPRRHVKLARIRAHDAFDVLWRRGYMSRPAAYAWLSREMGVDEAHMKTMGCEECERVVELVEELLRDLAVETMPPESFEGLEGQ